MFVHSALQGGQASGSDNAQNGCHGKNAARPNFRPLLDLRRALHAPEPGLPNASSYVQNGRVCEVWSPFSNVYICCIKSHMLNRGPRVIAAQMPDKWHRKYLPTRATSSSFIFIYFLHFLDENSHGWNNRRPVLQNIRISWSTAPVFQQLSQRAEPSP